MAAEEMAGAQYQHTNTALKVPSRACLNFQLFKAHTRFNGQGLGFSFGVYMDQSDVRAFW